MQKKIKKDKIVKNIVYFYVIFYQSEDESV